MPPRRAWVFGLNWLRRMPRFNPTAVSVGPTWCALTGDALALDFLRFRQLRREGLKLAALLPHLLEQPGVGDGLGGVVGHRTQESQLVVREFTLGPKHIDGEDAHDSFLIGQHRQNGRPRVEFGVGRRIGQVQILDIGKHRKMTEGGNQPPVLGRGRALQQVHELLWLPK